jgi:cytochrome P450
LAEQFGRHRISMARRVKSLPPGPSSPAVWQLLRYTHSPLPYLEASARRFGDQFTFQMAGYPPLVLLSSPETVREVLRGDPQVLHSGEGNEFLNEIVGRNSVLVLDDEPHQRQRRILMPPLKGERMRSFFNAMQAATFEKMKSWAPGQTVSMLEPMQDITLQVMLKVVLGLSDPAQLVEFAVKVRRVLQLVRGRYGLILVKILPFKKIQKTRWLPFDQRMRELNALLYALIEDGRRRPAEARGENILADLLAATHQDGQPLSDEEVRDAVVTLIFAGHDTTSIALAWFLEQVIPRSDVVEQIDAELKRVTGGDPPKADQLTQLTYLDAVIRESLRIRTLFPFVVRLTKAPFTVAGREFPPGVLLCPCIHLVHHREDLYPEPDRFRPERFLERSYSGHEWFPFGGGNRICLGMAFAIYEMKVVLSTLLATRRLARPPGSRSVAVRQGLALAPHDYVPMTILN